MDVNLWNIDKEMAKRTIKQYCSSWSELRYDEMHNKPYFVGKRRKGDETQTIYPINCNKVLTFNQLKAGITDSGSSAVNLAIYGTDSSVVLYKAHLGLKLPFPLPDPDSHLPTDDSESSKKRKIDSVDVEDEESVTDSQKESGSTNKQSKTGSTADVSEIKITSDNDGSVSKDCWGPVEI